MRGTFKAHAEAVDARFWWGNLVEVRSYDTRMCICVGGGRAIAPCLLRLPTIAGELYTALSQRIAETVLGMLGLAGASEVVAATPSKHEVNGHHRPKQESLLRASVSPPCRFEVQAHGRPLLSRPSFLSSPLPTPSFPSNILPPNLSSFWDLNLLRLVSSLTSELEVR